MESGGLISRTRHVGPGGRPQGSATVAAFKRDDRLAVVRGFPIASQARQARGATQWASRRGGVGGEWRTKPFPTRAARRS